MLRNEHLLFLMCSHRVWKYRYGADGDNMRSMEYSLATPNKQRICGRANNRSSNIRFTCFAEGKLDEISMKSNFCFFSFLPRIASLAAGIANLVAKIAGFGGKNSEF